MKPKNKTDKYAKKSSNISDVPTSKNVPDNIFYARFPSKNPHPSHSPEVH